MYKNEIWLPITYDIMVKAYEKVLKPISHELTRLNEGCSIIKFHQKDLKEVMVWLYWAGYIDHSEASTKIIAETFKKD